MLIRHIRQSILSVNLRTSLMKVLAHREVLEIGRQARGDAVLLLLLLQTGYDEHLEDDHAPEDAPDCEDTAEGVYLGVGR